MKISFLGAVREVTGSMHLLEINGRWYLLDCGLQQGKRKLAYERNRQLEKLIPIPIPQLAGVFLSHAHIDHSGALPILWKKGFRGTIYATSATRDLCSYMLADSGRLQEHDVDYVNKLRGKQKKNLFEPLYTEADAQMVMPFFQTVSYEQTFSLGDDLQVTYHDAGHMLGSAMIEFVMTGHHGTKKLIYTGDIGRPNAPILKNPWEPTGADILVMEATYGNRQHEAIEEINARLKTIILRAVANGSKVIIPSFSVGRTQEVVYAIHQLLENHEIPEIPIFVDSPLSVNATEVHRKHPECFDEEIIQFLQKEDDPFGFSRLKYVLNREESMALNRMRGPMIIISSSGMCEGGRILHHLKNSVTDPNNIILIIGFMAENTLGRRILDREPIIKIFGVEYSLNAQVEVIEAFSAHADCQELLNTVIGNHAVFGEVCLVHSEPIPAQDFAQTLATKTKIKVTIPTPGQTITF